MICEQESDTFGSLSVTDVVFKLDDLLIVNSDFVCKVPKLSRIILLPGSFRLLPEVVRGSFQHLPEVFSAVIINTCKRNHHGYFAFSEKHGIHAECKEKISLRQYGVWQHRFQER